VTQAKPGRLTELALPRFRVIIDNDFAGDPDGLVQLAHHLLSASCDIRAVISSHLKADDTFWNPFENSALEGVRLANEIIDLVGQTGCVPVLRGSELPMSSVSAPVDNEAVEFIVAEAMRTDVESPLFVACGGSLTQIASAYLREPAIAERLTLVWIGGGEHPGVHVPRGVPLMEYNTDEDIFAAQVVFNHSNLRLWQIPRDAYRQTTVSLAELEVGLGRGDALGAYLADKLGSTFAKAAQRLGSAGEAYVMGDSPLVLLTAMQTTFEPDTASSFHRDVSCPTLRADGGYDPNPAGRPIRVYHQIDNRTMFEDFFAKLELYARNRD
jgi:inosine-uridine nucleoside N-ribohydrolase